MVERKIKHYVGWVQILLWICVFLAFAAAMFFIGSNISVGAALKASAESLFYPFLIYMANYYLLIPRLFFAGRRGWFVMVNVIAIISIIFLPVLFMPSPVDAIENVAIQEQITGFNVWKFLLGVILIRILLYISMIALAVGMRYVIRWYEEKKKLEEERRRNTEAELNWLKNQLNPHFLFNTLNNISSLVRLDADKAQDSIARLSDLLRYALYESNNSKVKVVDEVEFMRNYIELMTLRCNDKTKVEVYFCRFDEVLTISPLLFISLIENAFKHGVSAHVDSFVTVDMGMEEGDIVFTCINSVIEKTTADYSGSGIGIENMKRRLELLYPGNYSYEQHQENEKYIVQVRLKHIADYV